MISAGTAGLTALRTLCHSVADPDPSDPYVLSLLDPDLNPLIRGTDPDPDPSIIKQK